MTAQIEKQISASPPAPARSKPKEFPDKGDAFASYIEGMPAEYNELKDQINIVAQEVNSNALAAAAQAGVATEQAELAAARLMLVQLEGTTQIEAVDSAGTTQVGLVQSAGTTQVGLVQSAGSVQITAVEAAGGVQIGLAADQVSLATTQAELASAAADQAILTADAVEWASADTYNKGRVVYDPFDDYKAYISQDDNNHGHVPSTDDGTWWTPILPPSATQAEMEAGIEEADRLMSPTGVKQAIFSLSPPDKLFRLERTSNIALASSDHGKLIDIVSGTFTQIFSAASTLGDGWWCYIRNGGTGDITLDPYGSETIDGLASFTMYPGETRIIQCTGTALYSVVLSSFYKEFIVSGTFIVPPGYATFNATLWGGGGGGGGGHANASGGYGGGGGGGGGLNLLDALRLTPGISVSVTVGAGGSGGTGGSGGYGTIGGTGGTSSFGTYGAAYGGTGGTSSSDPQGGYGSGIGQSLRQSFVLSSVMYGTTVGPLLRGDMGGGFCGAKPSRYKAAYCSYADVWDYVGSSEYGGSGGGSGGVTPLPTYGAGPGGRSLYGATGGGGGGAFGGSGTTEAGAAGGGILSTANMNPINFIGGGASSGVAGAVLSSKYGSGGGGGGGGGNASGSGYAGGNGASPGGGGGGGGGSNTIGGNGGSGGSGKVKVWGNI